MLKILFGHDNISKIPGDTPKYTPTTPAFGNPGSAPGGHLGLLSPCVERLGLDWKVRLKEVNLHSKPKLAFSSTLDLMTLGHVTLDLSGA